MTLNVTTVKLFPKIKFQCFWNFQPLNKGKCLSISWFVTCYCLKKDLKICNNSKFIKELEIFENWTVHGPEYAFHESWLH
jgi:hypothetical protein